jgi:hypothetical protein
MRCRKRPTSPSTRRHSTASQSRSSPSGPFTTARSFATVVAVEVAVTSNLPLSSGVVDHRVFAGSPDARQRSFEPNHPGLVSGRLSDTTTRRLRSPVSVFPVPFGVPAFACCVIPSPLRTSALLTVGLPSHLGLDLNGITTFRRCETRSGWASPLSRGGGILPTGRTSPIGACRFPAASPSPSLPQPVYERSGDETSTEIHTINPSDLSLARSPRTERAPLDLPPSFTPDWAGPSHACQGGDRS